MTALVPTATEARAQVAAHPAADLFPWMTDAELEELAQDILKNGQREPIIIVALEGKQLVLDGRNRMAACLMAGVAPRTMLFISDTAASEYVRSMNLLRRHLTSDQRAAVAVQLEEAYRIEAAARRAAGGRRGGRGEGPAQADELPGKGRALAKAAEDAKAGLSKASMLKKVKKAAPAVFALFNDGKIDAATAERIALLPEDARDAEVARIRAGESPAKKPRGKGKGRKAEVAEPAAAEPEDDARQGGLFAPLFPDSGPGADIAGKPIARRAPAAVSVARPDESPSMTAVANGAAVRTLQWIAGLLSLEPEKGHETDDYLRGIIQEEISTLLGNAKAVAARGYAEGEMSALTWVCQLLGGTPPDDVTAEDLRYEIEGRIEATP